jgi:hypothetical protein
MIQVITNGSAEAAAFVSGMKDLEDKWITGQKIFMEFCVRHGWDAWHIHDGWVKEGHDGYRTGMEVWRKDKCNITWIKEHAGYSHSIVPPMKGGKLVLLSGSPDLSDKQMWLRVYACVKSVKEVWIGERISLTYLDQMKFVLDKYENRYKIVY